jgi:hypothetical protein
MIKPIVTLALLTTAYWVTDYWTGRDWFSKHGIDGRSIYYTGPMLMALTGLVWPPLAWLGLGWSLWRSVFGWSSFGGRIDPQNLKDCLHLFFRDMVSMVFVIPALVYACGVSLTVAMSTMTAFCVVAVLIAYFVVTGGEKQTPPVDAVPASEAYRGWAFGVFAFLALVMK